MPYRSPFITETNEPAFTDCQICAGLMLVAEWTDGEAIHDRQGNTLHAGGLKRLRERLRVLSGDAQGGASLEDLARGIARRFPELPPLPRTTAPVEPLHLAFDELWARLEAGHCAVLDGNPVKVSDRSSPLRSMQSMDDYDHAVFVHTAQVERAFVMDPLGRGRYQGQWVSKVDLRQFASRFTTSSGSPYCAVSLPATSASAYHQSAGRTTGPVDRVPRPEDRGTRCLRRRTQLGSPTRQPGLRAPEGGHRRR